MYCPRCNIEYRSGFTSCADCGASLLEGLPQTPAPVRSRVRPHIPTGALLLAARFYSVLGCIGVAYNALALFLKPLGIPIPWESRLREPIIAALIGFGRALPWLLLVHLFIVLSIGLVARRVAHGSTTHIPRLRLILALEASWQSLMLVYRPVFTFSKPYLDPLGRPAVIQQGLFLMLGLSLFSAAALALVLSLRSRLAQGTFEEHQETVAA